MDELKAQVARHLAKGAWDTCPTCGGDKAEIVEQLASVPLLSGASIPSAVVICRHCGHVRLFSARILGLPQGGPGARAPGP